MSKAVAAAISPIEDIVAELRLGRIVILVDAYLTLRGNLHPDGQQTTNFMLVVVGAGALILSTRWFGVALVTALTAWPPSPFLRGDPGRVHSPSVWPTPRFFRP